MEGKKKKRRVNEEQRGGAFFLRAALVLGSVCVCTRRALSCSILSEVVTTWEKGTLAVGGTCYEPQKKKNQWTKQWKRTS